MKEAGKEEPKSLPVEAIFEVNLTEALSGWRMWHMEGKLYSYLKEGVWNPDEPCEAVGLCRFKHALVPHEHCTCGLYAVDSMDEVYEHDNERFTIVGQVYGWGRYVRGGLGWRSQFAYPKSFHLSSEQANCVDHLRKYHVPIYIEQSIKIYDPVEDGYEHRGDEENWNCGASEESSAAKGGSAGEDEEE